MAKPAILVLEDGSIFKGVAVGAQGVALGEVVFNTAMTGYQEVLTDPSYARQMVTFTYPHIGNTGTNTADQESNGVFASGFIIRDLPLLLSSWRAEKSLDEYAREHQLVGIAGVDTRRLTRLLRNKGALRGCIVSDESLSEAQAQEKAQALPSLAGQDLAQHVTTEKPYAWTHPVWCAPKTQLPVPEHHYHVVVYDFGVKHSILRHLATRGCRLTVVPAKTSAEDVLALAPDGVLLSNGPGDPDPCDYAIEAIRTLIPSGVPILGICLGFQLMALACGARTTKMKFGHHGANHPVQRLSDNVVMITSQNHGFCVDEKSLPEDLRITHRSLFDDTLQGFEHVAYPCFGFQGHPEAGPGPEDALNLFDRFTQCMFAYRQQPQSEATLCQKEPI